LSPDIEVERDVLLLIVDVAHDVVGAVDIIPAWAFVLRVTGEQDAFAGQGLVAWAVCEGERMSA
jgi:hypothetical protein